ncbi:hypothetical protein [Burkholderia sp. Ax-1719]|nr:hypothetical protein [Burkholderia sp. Ax-1719]
MTTSTDSGIFGGFGEIGMAIKQVGAAMFATVLSEFNAKGA